MSTFLQTISPVMGAGETVSSVTLTPTVAVGSYWADGTGNQYVYAYNAGNQQISQGQFAVPATGVSGFSATVSSTTFVDIAFGVARNATFATAAYGWLMYRGFTGLSTDNVSFAAGQAVILGSNGNFQPATSAAGSFVTATIVGKAVAAIVTGVTASTTTLQNTAFINMM